MKALFLAACFYGLLTFSAFADENGDSATVSASITTYSPQASITADNHGRCWIGDMEVDCLTQDYIERREIQVAAVNETVRKSTVPHTSGE
jgi:hypothetical protein